MNTVYAYRDIVAQGYMNIVDDGITFTKFSQGRPYARGRHPSDFVSTWPIRTTSRLVKRLRTSSVTFR